MFTIFPEPRATKDGASARATENGPERFAPMSSSQSATENSENGARRCTPALLTRMSGTPWSATSASTPRATASESVTSNVTAPAG